MDRGYFGALTASVEEAGRAVGDWIEHDLVIGRLGVRLRFAGPALVPAIFPALSHLASEHTVGPSLTISFCDSESTGVVPPKLSGWEGLHPLGEIFVMRDAGIQAFLQSAIGALTVFHATSGSGVFWARSPDDIPWWERTCPLRVPFHWLLTGRRRHIVHAGAVGANGGGALLAGGNGAGKSTLSVACLEAGFDFVGDDFVLLSLENEQVAFSLYGTAKLDDVSLGLLPGMGEAFLPPSEPDQDKSILWVGGYAPERLRAGLPVTALVAPSVSGERRTRLRPVSAREGLKALAPSTIIYLRHEAADSLETMAELVSRVPSYALELGDDLSEAPKLLAAALERA